MLFVLQIVHGRCWNETNKIIYLNWNRSLTKFIYNVNIQHKITNIK